MQIDNQLKIKLGLSHPGLLCISGEGAKKLLQGQLTCDLEQVSENPILGAHCNPQGRVISLFRIFLLHNNYYLSMPLELVPIALQALQKYAPFFKATLTNVSEATDSNEQAKLSDIQQGIPAIYPETSEKFLPHELNLPQLNAVSFNKGCFTGQEIIARMQYRGKLKSQLIHAKLNTALPVVRGHDIYSDNQPAGSIVDYAQVGYNQFELLVIAPTQPKQLSIDVEKTAVLEF